MNTLPFVNLGVAGLLIGISIPLILRKVPMNHFYGIRFAASFKSEKNWYAINVAGGKLMTLWAIPLLLWGIAGFFLKDVRSFSYVFWNPFVMLGCVLIACGQSYLAARKIDRQNHPRPKHS